MMPNDDRIAFLAKLNALGEHTAVGFLARPGADPLTRMTDALASQWGQAQLCVWDGGPLYPAGRYSWYQQGGAVSFHYSSVQVDHGRLTDLASRGDPSRRRVYARLLDEWGDYPQPWMAIPPAYRVGGANYTHSILNYGRVVREGLEAYDERLARHLDAATPETRPFYRAMATLLGGLRTAHKRSLAHLRACVPGDGASMDARDRLMKALERVPWKPARTFYEGLVAINWLYYIDGCDSLGRFDQDLGPLYEADLSAGRLDRDEGISLVRALWRNVDANDGWNVALGGTLADGSSAANALTETSLRAGVGLRRPNLALRVTDDLPRPAVEAALDSLASGNGLPALYDDGAYRRAMQDLSLGLRPQDRGDFAFGGCTELMVHGKSNVGSLDAGLNLPAILAGVLRGGLPTAYSYEELFAAFVGALNEHAGCMADAVNKAQAMHAQWQPQPIRTLLIDDCLDVGREYNAGGARYNWSVINVGGLANVADSLAVLRRLVFEEKVVTGAEFLEALDHDWRDHADLRRRSQQLVPYGNDENHVDGIARDVAAHTFAAVGRHRPWRGGRFLPACLMFVTYADVGASVMATPDGRGAGEPIADAIGPVAGRDRRGPTAMLRSVASLPQELAPGTLVTNLRLSPRLFSDDVDRQRVWDLLRTYFRLGGMQLQVNVLDQEALEEAMEHPDAYGDLIVRVGGYSEYWRNLSDDLRRTVLERSEHDL